MTDALDTLRATWHREIPLTDAMDLEPVAFEDHALTVRARLAPNVNVHGTAFAGSLYATTALAGWGLVHLELEAAGIDGAIVIAEGGIRYRRPVAADIVAHCAIDPGALATGLAALREAGRTRFSLVATVAGDEGDAVIFEGVYAVRVR
jgi:thioesterase domain-containing protein